jgi:hypothetical protein
MKCFLLLAISALTAMAQVPSGAHRVYVMPMAGGLDQYLADWITRQHVMQVMTDPKAADVILTDRIGEAFEQKLTELYPPPPEKKADDKTPDSVTGGSGTAGTGMGGAHINFRSTAARGTIFMVETKSKQVVWSAHEKPVEPTDANLNREAERIVKKLATAPAKQ